MQSTITVETNGIAVPVLIDNINFDKSRDEVALKLGRTIVDIIYTQVER